MKNYYNILEVNQNASIEVIEKAYKVLVKKYHPDLQKNNPHAEEKMSEINEAYDVLSDTFLREQYDNELKREERKKQEQSKEEYERLYQEKEALKQKLKQEEAEKTENQNNKFFIKHSITGVDVLALVLTILIIIALGLILYVLPFTHDWMNENFIDTPIVRLFKNAF